MGICIESLLDGAKREAGSVAIIDVFRAFTTAAVALANGESRIIIVGTVEEALSLRDNGIARLKCKTVADTSMKPVIGSSRLPGCRSGNGRVRAPPMRSNGS